MCNFQFNQPTNQATNQPTDQSTNQLTTNRPINKTINQLTHQHINQAINQLTNQPSNQPDHDEKSLHRHTIPCFASSRSSFGLQLGSRETPHASHPETEEEPCLRRNQRRAARAVWVRCEPSTPRRDPKTGELARSSKRHIQLFLLNHCRSQHNQACLPGPPCCSSREGVTHSKQVPGERELKVVQEAQSWCPIPVRADLLRRPAAPFTKRVWSGTHH